MENISQTYYERMPHEIDDTSLNSAIKHAIGCFPNECCGVFTVHGYKALTNIAEDKRESFRIKENRAVASMSHEVIALFHSHTSGNAWAGREDMLTQIASNKPHGICVLAGKGGIPQVKDIFFWESNNIPSLLGRFYRPNTMDCFSLIRDAYKQWYGIVIPEVPREPDALECGELLYENGFVAAGFKQVPITAMAPGDVLLGRILSANFNHGALVIDNKHIIHHYRDRLSRRDELSQWAQIMNTCLRHNSFSGLPPLPANIS